MKHSKYLIQLFFFLFVSKTGYSQYLPPAQTPEQYIKTVFHGEQDIVMEQGVPHIFCEEHQSKICFITWISIDVDPFNGIEPDPCWEDDITGGIWLQTFDPDTQTGSSLTFYTNLEGVETNNDCTFKFSNN